jgi:hypothetical protein
MFLFRQVHQRVAMNKAGRGDLTPLRILVMVQVAEKNSWLKPTLSQIDLE